MFIFIEKFKDRKPLEVLLDYYADMCDTITDVNDLSRYLVSLRIITPQDEKDLRDVKASSLQVKKYWIVLLDQ